MSASNGGGGGSIPLRRRLAASLAASIQDGRPPPGERLPGIRDMACRVGVHRHTVAAAYQELAAAGLVVSVPGSGTFVAEPHWPLLAERPESCPDSALRAFLAAEREAGRSAGGLLARLNRWRRQLATKRLLVVEPEAALRRLLTYELERSLGWAVEPLSPVRLRRDRAFASALRGVPVGRPSVLARYVRRLPTGADALPLPLRGGARELQLVRSLPPRSVVAVVTESELVRRRARELMAGATERGTGLLLPRPDDRAALRRAQRVADLIFADALCGVKLAGRGRLVELRVLQGSALARVRAWLGVPVRRARFVREAATPSHVEDRHEGTGRVRAGRGGAP